MATSAAGAVAVGGELLCQSCCRSVFVVAGGAAAGDAVSTAPIGQASRPLGVPCTNMVLYPNLIQFFLSIMISWSVVTYSV
jgi:hypothetical protein